ncbi:hypothetical protein Poli38472_004964 [Pythium oligandrum]|uniref:Uncharacterized protein n=1 Tax=Pythium oligandrum TaxID=41045 RepID=A0A8K1FDX5_PYTOL|nr:hypothetical protein Poli38472_004964 [Pythium oligandrum]|eukprot:TMW59895.1 hypothetical protein Poli38472_004964 [Pythium oligandrum]
MAWVVPYPVRLVEDALWHLIQRKTAWQEGRGYQNQIVTEDLVLLSFASSDPRLAGEYSGKLATKRFYVGPESLFVTSMKAAPQGDALKMPGGLVVLQKAWTQVRALDDAASTQPLVQIQSRRCRN